MFFFFNDTATTEIYTLSLHDALPISGAPSRAQPPWLRCCGRFRHPLIIGRLGQDIVAPCLSPSGPERTVRSEEHTSELQSQSNLVCRLLLEKKKQIIKHLAV